MISASIAFLLTARQSTRSQKSHRLRERAALLAGALHRLDGGVADALHGVEPEADVALHDHELVVGEVHVRRQDLDPHLLAAGDEERDLVLGGHDRADQRRHVLGGVVGLQPRGAVGDQRVTGGVGAVERVVGGPLVGHPQLLDHRLGGARRAAARHELGLELRHRLAVLLADRLAQVVRARAGEAAERLGDLHRLLLVQDHALGRLGDRAQAVVDVGDRVGVALAAGVGRDLVHGARAVERVRARRGPRTRSAGPS